jgi:hypothetical protein
MGLLLTSIKGRSRALVQGGDRTGGRADEQGSLSLSLSLANACNPLLQVHLPWAQDKHEAAVPLIVPPCVPSRADHLGWDTQRQFSRRSRDPLGSKRR